MGLEVYSAAALDIDGALYRGNLVEHLYEALVVQGTFPTQALEDLAEQKRLWQEHREKEPYDLYLNSLVASYVENIRGVSLEEMNQATSGILAWSPRLMYRFTKDILRKFRGTHRFIAISGAPAELVGPLASRLGFTDFHAASYEVVDGIYTGKATAGHLNKDRTLLEMVEKHGLTLEGSIGVGDTDSDIPMLELVTHPFAIHPNDELAQHAKANAWTTVYERKNVIVAFDASKAEYRKEGGFGYLSIF